MKSIFTLFFTFDQIWNLFLDYFLHFKYLAKYEAYFWTIFSNHAKYIETIFELFFCTYQYAFYFRLFFTLGKIWNLFLNYFEHFEYLAQYEAYFWTIFSNLEKRPLLILCNKKYIFLLFSTNFHEFALFCHYFPSGNSQKMAIFPYFSLSFEGNILVLFLGGLNFYKLFIFYFGGLRIFTDYLFSFFFWT